MRKLKITELNRISNEDFQRATKIPLVVILDNVRSLHNVGSVFRTSDAFLIDSVILCGITSPPPHPEIHKTALGAENTVKWDYVEQTTQVVRHLKSQGYIVWAIEQAEGSIALQHFQWNGSQKLAIILGNEVKGVEQEVIDLCDGCIEIPQFGTKHSLNVSVTAGIVIYQLAIKTHSAND